MSEIRVTNILGENGNSPVNFTQGINMSGIVTATSFVPSQGQLSHRNLIINGAMNVAQRGSTSTAQGYHTIDRIYQLYSGTDEAPTFAQADVTSGGAYDAGFRKCLKITNGNQTSGAGAGDRVRFEYRIEAQDLANSGWNYTSASSFITLSFWVKSSVAQNFYARFYSYDGTPQAYSFETGALTANTWTKVTKIIPGNSNLQFDNNNAAGMIISFTQYAGSNYTDAGNTMNTWAAYSGSSRYPTNTSTWYTTNDATWEFTGLQFEVGPVATSFEHRSFGDEIQRCQRYYEKSYKYADAPGTSTDSGSVMFLTNRSPGTAHTMLRYMTRKRAAPTLVSYDPTQSNTTGMRNLDANATYSYSMNRNGETGCTAYPSGSLNLGQFIQFHYTADAEL